MNPIALFRHYTGRMSAQARWYLAGLGMFSLCLLAAHFAVQEHVQRNMRQAVRGWLAQNGGSVNHVRYHLLRGVLTLEGVHWADATEPGLSMDVAQVSILTSSRAMASPSPSFLFVRLVQPVLSLPRARLVSWLRGDSGSEGNAMAGLLAHARIVSLNSMDLRLLSDVSGKGKSVMLLQQVSGVLRNSGMRIGGLLDAGVFQFGARMAANGLTGEVELTGVPLAVLTPLIGSAVRTPGVVASGALALSGNWNRRDVGLQGRLELQDDKAASVADLHAGWSKKGSHLDMQCNNVLLTGLPIDWPAFAGRHLTAGRLSGLLHLDRSWHTGGWRIGMDGKLSGLALTSKERPGWSIGSVQLSRARLLPTSGELTAAQMQLADADLSFDTGSLATGETLGPTPHIDSLTLQHIRPRLRFADGAELALPELSGSGKMGKTGHVSLSTRRDQGNGNGSDAGEAWKIVVDGDAYAAWRARVSATHVPLVRLRPLLPDLSLPGQQGVPEYGGSADFSLHMSPSASGLQLAGNAVLHDASMTQGGDEMTAGRIEVDIADAVSGGPRRLSRVDIGDWQYQMALHPLARLVDSSTLITPASPTVAAAKQDGVAEVKKTAAEKAGMALVPGDTTSEVESRPKWEIDEMTAHDGRISLGQPDALIANGLHFSVSHLSEGRMASFTMGGSLGDGFMQGRGAVQLQPGFALSMKASLRHALPFVFNDWMQLSGMPRFVRGRFDADLGLTTDHRNAVSAYRGRLRLRLFQGELEDGPFPTDPLAQRAGYSARELMSRLGPTRHARLSIPFHGDWQGATLGDTLGDATLTTLKRQAGKAVATSASTEPTVVKLTGLRLHGKRGFSLNERARLRRMARVLWRDKKLIVELTPKLGSGPLDADLIARIRRTQILAERYMRHLGVSVRRIYPVWPQASQPHGDAPGLLLRARHS